MLAVAAVLGPLVAAGPLSSVTAEALPPADDGPLGATGVLPDFFTPPGDTSPLATGPGGAGLEAGAGEAVAGIPAGMLAAYRRAETNLAASAPGCRLGWALVAAIGKVESSHARGGRIDAEGTTTSPILGPRLDGSGANAAIPDTDGGAFDGDTVWDRAVGPTQFIPSTWQAYGVDANGDGRADPNNAHDATTATGRYLCAGGLDLSDPGQLHDAVFRYNHSESYVATVLSWARRYASGATATPDATGNATGNAEVRAAGRDPITLAALAGPAPAPPGTPPGAPGVIAAPVAPARGGPATAVVPGSPASTSPQPPAGGPAPPAAQPPAALPPAATAPVPAPPGRPGSPSSPPVTTPTPGPSTAQPSTPRPSTPRPSVPRPGTTAPPTTTAPAAAMPTAGGDAVRACEQLPTAAVAAAFARVPGAVSRSSDANGCQYRADGALLLTVDVTQSNGTNRESDGPVVESGQGRQLVIRFGERNHLRLTVPADAAMTTTSARAGLAVLAARLW